MHRVAGVGERLGDVRISSGVLGQAMEQHDDRLRVAVRLPSLVVDGQVVRGDEGALAVEHCSSLPRSSCRCAIRSGSCQDDVVATRKPIPAEYQIFDRRFLDLIIPGAKLSAPSRRQPVGGGPVYLPDSDVLLWSDVRRNRCMRLDVATGEVSLHMQPANFNNGHTRERRAG